MYKILKVLKEIKSDILINLFIDKEPYIKEITNDNIINLTGQSGSGKSTYALNNLNTDDYLIIEDWMREEKDLDSLAVSLRNDSDEYEKSNKNMYALKEEVVYYVDYKNGGKDINNEVKLVLELPLDVQVIDACGGKVVDDTEDNESTCKK